MSQIKKRVLVFAGVLVLTALFLLSSPEHEPIYNGRSLSEWFQIVLSSSGEETAEAIEARVAIETIGTNAIPILVQWIRHDPNVAHWWYEVPLLGDWLDKRWAAAQRKSMEATAIFSMLGPIASPAIPSLNEMLLDTKSEYVRESAAYCLVAIQAPAVPEIVSILEQKTHPARRDIVYWLWLGLLDCDPFSNNFAAVIPPLVTCTLDPDEAVAADAMQALGNLRSRPDLSLPVLMINLESTNDVLCVAAGLSLSRYTESASNAIPTLQGLLIHTNSFVRSAAEEAIEDIQMNKPCSGYLVDPVNRPNLPGKKASAILNSRAVDGSAPNRTEKGVQSK